MLNAACGNGFCLDLNLKGGKIKWEFRFDESVFYAKFFERENEICSGFT